MKSPRTARRPAAKTSTRKPAAAAAPAAPESPPSAPSAVTSARPARKDKAAVKAPTERRAAVGRKGDATVPPPAAGSTAPAQAAAAAAPNKAPKPNRPRLVRDSFTMPESDFGLLATLKKRALGAGRETRKTEVLRAALQLLSTLDVAALVAALESLEPVKTGRPKKAR